MSNFNSMLTTNRRTLRVALMLTGALALGLAFTACDGGGGGGTPGPVDPCVENAVNCTPLATLLDTGAIAFENCTGCHSNEGRGSAGGTPPLANSDYFMANKTKTIAILLGGYSDSIFVNGLWYQGSMPPHDYFSNLKIASVLTYLRVIKNDSTVVSCDSNNLDPEGFPVCQKTARDSISRYSDTVAVWQVKRVRDSLNIPEPDL